MGLFRPGNSTATPQSSIALPSVAGDAQHPTTSDNTPGQGVRSGLSKLSTSTGGISDSIKKDLAKVNEAVSFVGGTTAQNPPNYDSM